MAGSVPGHPDSDSVDPQTGELLAAPLPVLDRLDEVAGIGRYAAPVIIAEVGLDIAMRSSGKAAGCASPRCPTRRPATSPNRLPLCQRTASFRS